MTYGIPESAGMSIEKADKTQYWKCLQCALEGIDNHLTDIYQLNGTIYCLFHAQKAHGPIDTSVNISNQVRDFDVPSNQIYYR